MPNPYFQFKSFTVYQDRCALKVSTDSCVFGAWVANKLAYSRHHLNACLDIGAGTGLLMLMIAQQFPGLIDGVEIDKNSCEQASENIAASPWHSRLRVFNSDVKLFSLPQRYDVIVSNPPFYEGDLKSANQRYNFAKHDAGLTLKDLAEFAERNLSEKGLFAVLLPSQRASFFIGLAASHGLFPVQQLDIRQTTKHPSFRTAFILQREQAKDILKEEIIIRLNADTYTKEFIGLMKEYYLYL